MMKKTNHWIALVSLTCVVVLLTAYFYPDRPSYAMQIEAILAKAQTADDQYSDRLAALGPGAISALEEKLLEQPKFPVKYIRALHQIGDKRAVLPLIEFLEKQLSYPHESVSLPVNMTLKALGDLADQRATSVVLTAFNTPDIHPKTRLAAAATLVQLGDVKYSHQASVFIMEQYQNRHQFYNKMGAGFEAQDIHAALIAHDTNESVDILLKELVTGTPARLSLPIIKYLATKNHPDIIKTLIHILNQPRFHEMHVRLTAIEALQSMTHQIPTAKMHSYLDEFINQQNEGQFYDDLRSRAKALKQQLKLNVGAT